MTSPLSIMCFSWNADGLRFCETMSQSKADEARKGFKAFITAKKPCVTPDFFEDIRTLIINKRPSIVVMSTEDEDRTDTYFHSDLLPSSMPEIGYRLLKRDVLTGVGEIASGVTMNKIPSGTPSGSALRISIYIKDSIYGEFQSEEKTISKFFSNHGNVYGTCKDGDRISGAIASYIWHEVYGKFAFIAVDLPSGAKSLITDGLNYEYYRAANKASNNLCMIYLMKKFVNDLTPEAQPDHIFILGDFNYDIVVPGKKSDDLIAELINSPTASKYKELQQYDELKSSLSEPPLKGFKEGPGGEGPLFMPTWKLNRGRDESCSTTFNRTCFESGNSSIGWHDRILYKELMTSHYIAHCKSYNRLDVRHMHSSRHAGVVAFFDMEPIH